MRIKTVRLDEATRNVLIRSKIEGKCLTLPEQLERADYMHVAKAIEAAGGKWSKKDRCHIFPADVRETMDIKEDTMAVLNVQQTYQFFPTPEPVANELMLWADLLSGQRVLEPSAGTGNLARAAVQQGIFWSHITAVEINERMAKGLEINGCKVICADFLTCNGDLGKFDRIIMNPPFSMGDDIKHVRHALTMLDDGGRLVAIVADGPKQREAFPDANWVKLPKKSFAASGTDVNTAIVIIERT